MPAIVGGGAVEHVGAGEEQGRGERDQHRPQRPTAIAHERGLIRMLDTGTCTSSTPPTRIGVPGSGPQACA
ncbi:hypothetical protein D3C71_1732810 [compost metagenome]